MDELEHPELPHTSEEERRVLIDYLKDADFGTPKYLALGDCLQLRQQERYLESLLGNCVAASEVGLKKRLSWESDLRMLEMRIALHQQAIDERSLNTRGYRSAYARINSSIESYGFFIKKEAKQQSSTNIQVELIESVMNLQDDLREALFKRQE